MRRSICAGVLSLTLALGCSASKDEDPSGEGGSSNAGAGGGSGSSAGASGGVQGTGGLGGGGPGGAAAGRGGTVGGAAGATGSAGTTGTAGTTGSAGATGVAGTTGTAGATGSAGAAGTTGVAATGGAAGAPGPGGKGGGAAGGAGGRDGGMPDGSVSDGGGDAMGDGGLAYMPCPTTAGTACTVLPLGDSITEGCCTAPMGGYRIELFRQAVLAGKNLTFVGTVMNGPDTVESRTFPKRHEGHGGYTIAGGGQGALAGKITDTAISSQHPNIVLLMIGTNDINGNINVSSAPTRLGQLIDEIIADAPTALVVVASVIPIRDDGSNQRIPNFNAAIPGLVNTRAAAGKHVVFLDNYAAFIKDASYKTSLMADGLHPNAAGYAVLGRAFYGVIGAALPSGS